jgi:hypothetical protein
MALPRPAGAGEIGAVNLNELGLDLLSIAIEYTRGGRLLTEVFIGVQMTIADVAVSVAVRVGNPASGECGGRGEGRSRRLRLVRFRQPIFSD